MAADGAAMSSGANETLGTRGLVLLPLLLLLAASGSNWLLLLAALLLLLLTVAFIATPAKEHSGKDERKVRNGK